MSNTLVFFLGLAFMGAVLFCVALAILFRKVVSTNIVHIVQRGRTTVSYGTGLEAGNVYYRWPSWIPKIGVTVIEFPVSNFDLSLENYDAYDSDRVPFMVDVASFFRVENTGLAAQRVATIQELREQLHLITRGAVRKVLSGDKIDNIMLERSKFGKAFTDEVVEQLKQWGVVPVKSMELMDIRDAAGSKVISNIMAKKTSHIEMESRKEVAANGREAEMAEITAQREIDIQRQQAEQAVGERTAEKDKAVGIANQQSRQEVLVQEKITRERDMDVKRVEQVKQAEIERDKQVVEAEQDKQTTIIRADGELEAQRKQAMGFQVVGEAKAAAEKAMQLAPVEAQIALAKEVGTNAGYQQYLVALEAVKAYISVGGAQAKALEAAEIKVIATAGTPLKGVESAMGLLTPQGGMTLGGMLEALSATPQGKEILGSVNKLLGGRLASIGMKPGDDSGALTANGSATGADETLELDADAGK